MRAARDSQRRRGLWLGAAGALVAAALVMGGDAVADPPERQGWWKRSVTVAGIAVGTVLDPSTADVPPDGLLVAGGASVDEPQAYAALAFDLGGGSLDGPLRLQPAAGAASVPDSPAMACPLDAPGFEPAQGGSIDAAPSYDCLGAVAATIADDGAYTFDVTTLQRGDIVAVAILPAATTTRVVLEAAGDDALPVTRTGNTALPGTVPTTAFSPAPSMEVPIGDVDFGVPTATAAPPEATATTAPEVAAPVPAASTGDADGDTARAFVLLGLAGVAMTGWLLAGRRVAPA